MKKATWLALGLLSAAVVGAPALAASAPVGETIAMVATAYGPSAADNYPYGPTDYFGQPLTAGDVAVDPSIIPLKTCLYVTGYSSRSLPAGGFIGEADDTGGAIKGDRVDLFMNVSPAQVSNFGIQHVTVKVLGPANTAAGSGTAACSQYSAGGTSGGQNSSGGNANNGAGAGNGATTNSGTGGAGANGGNAGTAGNAGAGGAGGNGGAAGNAGAGGAGGNAGTAGNAGTGGAGGNGGAAGGANNGGTGGTAGAGGAGPSGAGGSSGRHHRFGRRDGHHWRGHWRRWAERRFDRR